MGMALRSITNNSNSLVLDERQIGIFIIINVHSFLSAQLEKHNGVAKRTSIPLVPDTHEMPLYFLYALAAPDARGAGTYRLQNGSTFHCLKKCVKFGTGAS